MKKFWGYIVYALSGIVFSLVLVFYIAFFGELEEKSLILEETFASGGKAHDVALSFDTSARAFAVIDGNSGQLLASQNENEILPMASTTKIMTAVIVLENCELYDMVTIPPQAQGIEGSSIYLLEGERLSVSELLYGLMLESGNDAATALAIHTAGDIKSFCDMMNEKAKSLGLSSTHFENPHGLSHENHHTTAYELAMLSAYAMENENFRNIVSSKKYVIEKREGCMARYFSNHNRLLKTETAFDGIKTGYTKASGRCLVSSTNIDGNRFIVVTLDDKNDWQDHKALHNFAHESFESIKIAGKNELNFAFSLAGKRIFVTNPKDIFITRKKGDGSAIDISVEIAKSVMQKGERAGILHVNAYGNIFFFPLDVEKVEEN